MAEGRNRRTGANLASVSPAYAGPGGGTEEKPVGTCFIALVCSDGQATECHEEFFPTDRETFKQLTTQTALDYLRLKLL